MPALRLTHRLAALGARIPAPLMLIAALILLQVGSGVAKGIMTAETVLGLVLIRMVLGALGIGALVRPKLATLSRRQWADAALLGLVFAAFNVIGYLALVHLPLGLVATIGFLGPLAVSLSGARRLIDGLWPILGLVGVVLLTPISGTTTVTPTDLGYGLAYAGTWAAYILASARTGRSLDGLDGFVIATAIAAVLIAPLGADAALGFFATPETTRLTLVVAFLAILPLGLEFLALKRLPPRVFGVLLSLEPAIASLAGLALLGERLGLTDIAALAAVSAASIGVTVTRQDEPGDKPGAGNG